MTQRLFNFAIATDTIDDQEFIEILEKTAHSIGLSTFVVTNYNYQETMLNLYRGDIAFDFFYDRASDTSTKFLQLQNHMLQNGIPVMEPRAKLKIAANKATMHREFINCGIATPKTIILRPFDVEITLDISEIELQHIGIPFVVKPADTTGGGMGVVENALQIHDIEIARKEHRAEEYLLQEKVMPLQKNGHRYWFRCFYICDNIECCWWHDVTHVYKVVASEEVEQFNLHAMFDMVEKIAQICRLQFFSTEIALSDKGDFLVIDYVNEICDMRLQSKHYNGVPDELVKRIAIYIVNYVKNQIMLHPRSYYLGA